MRTTQGLTHVTRKEKRLPNSSHSRLEQSTDQDPSESMLPGSPPARQPGEHHWRWAPLVPRDALQLTCSVQFYLLCIAHFTVANVERKGHRAHGTRRQVNRNTEYTLGVSHGRILGQVCNRTCGILGQVNRMLHMHRTSKDSGRQ